MEDSSYRCPVLTVPKVREQTLAGLRSRRIYCVLPSLYEIDKTLFTKGTLRTLLSYRTLLNTPVLRGQEQTPTQAQGRSVTPSSTTVEDYREDSVSSSLPHSTTPNSVTLRFYLEVGSTPFRCLKSDTLFARTGAT